MRGQANDLDAFVVTKQAVYCLIYNWDPDTHFRHDGPDSRGIAIANKISELVAIGRYGTQTRQKAELNINKMDGFQNGTAPNTEWQDYAVTFDPLEDIGGQTSKYS